MVGWIGVTHGHWQWTVDDPGSVASSPGATRYFCRSCGTSLAYASDRWDYEIHFTAASLDDPGTFVPTFHSYFSEALPAVRPDDGLRRFDKTPSGN